MSEVACGAAEAGSRWASANQAPGGPARGRGPVGQRDAGARWAARGRRRVRRPPVEPSGHRPAGCVLDPDREAGPGIEDSAGGQPGVSSRARAWPVAVSLASAAIWPLSLIAVALVIW